MIIIKLQGGLGNQLFQYAFGRNLAAAVGTELKLDTSWFGKVPDRAYELDHFSISAPIATKQEVRNLLGAIPLHLRRRLGLTLPAALSEEQGHDFDASLLDGGSDRYLEGYFQSEQYFLPVADTLRKEFSLREALDPINQALLEEIGNRESVSVHIRRGDYVASPTANAFHGTCPPEYYHNALARVTKGLDTPHLYVFSDDLDWAKANLTFDHPVTYVDHNGSASYKDLRLMQACKHAVIANSTFSWWGAWLMQNKEKRVIAPVQWFADPNCSSATLIPDSWTRI